MIRPASLLLLLAVLPVAAQAPKPTALDKGSLEVSFPDTPKTTDAKGMVQHQLAIDGGKSLLLAVCTPFDKPIDITDKEGVKKILDAGVEGLKKTAGGGKILADRELKVGDKYPARELDVEFAGLILFRAKWIVTPTGFVQVMATGPKDFVDGDKAKAFFASLKAK